MAVTPRFPVEKSFIVECLGTPSNDDQLRQIIITLTPQSASERFTYLNTESKQLMLPPKYAVLMLMFDMVDKVIAKMLEDGRLTMFERLRVEVDQKLGKTNYFNLKLFGQIMTVFPEAYEVVLMPYKLPSKAGMFGLWVKPGDLHIALCDELLLERRTIFRQNLLYRTMILHDEFLKNNKVALPTNSRKRSWHPDFFDSQYVSDVKPADIPKPPVGEQNQQHSFISEYSELVANSSKLDKKSVIARMPDIIRFTAKLFYDEGEVVMLVEYLLEKIRHVFAIENLSTDEIMYHFHLLADYVPGYFAVFYINEDAFMEVDEKVYMTTIITKFKNLTGSE